MKKYLLLTLMTCAYFEISHALQPRQLARLLPAYSQASLQRAAVNKPTRIALPYFYRPLSTGTSKEPAQQHEKSKQSAPRSFFNNSLIAPTSTAEIALGGKTIYMKQQDDTDRIDRISLQIDQLASLKMPQKALEKYAETNETLVGMGQMSSVTVSPHEHTKKISTFGLCGCTSIVVYVIENGVQKAYLSHDSARGASQRRTQEIINDLNNNNIKPENIKIIIVCPGAWEQLNGKWKMLPKSTYKGIDEKLLGQFRAFFPQSKINISYSPYPEASNADRRSVQDGQRDATVYVDPNYKKSYFINDKEPQKVRFN